METIINFMPEKDPELICKQVKYFIDKGGEIFLGFSEGRLAHIARLCHYPGVIEKNSLEIHPPVKIKEDEVYIGLCQTSGEFRGKNIYPCVLQYLVKYTLSGNIKRCFGSTSPSNTASIRGIHKAGFKLVSTKWKFSVFGKLFNRTWSSSDV